MAVNAYGAIRDEVYHEIFSKLERKDEESRRFVPVGTAEEVLNDDRLRRFFRSLDEHEKRHTILMRRGNEDGLVAKIHERSLHRFLAVLLFACCSIQTARAFKLALVSKDTDTIPAFRSLPAKCEDLRVLFNDDSIDIDKFRAKQGLFCAVILYKGEEQQLDDMDHLRLPFIHETMIGKGPEMMAGPFCRVFKVKVAQGHLCDRELGSATTRPVTLARKDYYLTCNPDFDIRKGILKQILAGANMRCPNIVHPVAWLTFNSTRGSLFMPLAICDLREYMEVHKQQGPVSNEERKTLVQCAVGLALGLDFLHNGISSSTGPMACFDIDLKPDHILVFHEQGMKGQPEVVWKISNFELERCNPHRSAFYAGRIQFNRPWDSSSESSAEYLRADSTYLAPEAYDTVPAGTPADIWSLGCVLSVLFAYMEDGAMGVAKYAEERMKQPGTDSCGIFFVHSQQFRPLGLNSVVTKTHRRLLDKASKRDEEEGQIVKAVLEYLEQYVFQMGPSKRKNAMSMQLMLERTVRAYERLQSEQQLYPEHLPEPDAMIAREETESKLQRTAREVEPISWAQRVRQRLRPRIVRRTNLRHDPRTEAHLPPNSMQSALSDESYEWETLPSAYFDNTVKDHISLTSKLEESVSSRPDVALRTPDLAVAEGTATGTAYQSNQISSTGRVESKNTTDASTISDKDETSTIYSDAMTVPGSTRESYAMELCEQILLAISSDDLRDETVQQLFEALPDYLRAFALRLGSSSEPASHVQGDIMAFVHKYREYIAETLINRYEEESERNHPIERDGMPLDDIMSLWYTRDEAGSEEIGRKQWSKEWDRPDEETVVNRDNTGRDDQDEENPPQTDDEGLIKQLPNLEIYRDVILGSPAYQWLLTDISKQLVLIPTAPYSLESIREKIVEALPSPRHFSRRDPPRPSKLTIFMPWDPIGFLKEQEYKDNPADALGRVITLTGSRRVAQALTTEQYLCQTWPSSGRDVLDLLQKVLRRDSPGVRVSRTLSDGTVISSWIDKAHESIQIKATGTAYSLAEVGEQFAWIGAALRSSQRPDGVTSVRPKIKRLQVIRDNSKKLGKKYLAVVRCEFAFEVSPPLPDRRTEIRNGECWHNLFRNPVLVRGFPIARRPDKLVSVNGLEIPLYMMAGLAGAKSVASFCGRTVLKGFSTIIVPTYRYDNMVVWHLIHNPHGDRISYLECLAEHYKVGTVSSEQLQVNRHILGWCTKAKFLAGTEAGKYDVAGTRLPRPRTTGILHQVSISSGQVISDGAPFNKGYKDSPFYVARNGYIRKLKWISRRFVVLWDEDNKRGWLINGTSALLHLVRASLEQDSKDKFSSEFLFRVEKLEEAPFDAAYTPDSAIKVLLNRANLNLKLYREDDGYVVFKDRVEHVFRLMEQIMDHQINVSDSYGRQPSIASVSRAYLEGWDFHDLATDTDPVYPRVSNLSTLGMGWVEFIRSIHAVTLMGRGFGEIITSVEQSCTQWATVPMNRSYLAVSLSDVRDIMDAVGDATANPPRVTHGLAWLNTDAITAAQCCSCAGQEVDEHTDVVQVILPPGLADIPLANRTHQLEDGAVIFGYNKNIPWFWKETGDPVHGNAGSSTTPDRGILSPPDLDSGYGPSTAGESDSTPSTNPPTLAPSGAPAPRKVPPSDIKRRELRFGSALKLGAYKVGIICALPLELLPVRALFDVTHNNDDEIAIPSTDSNHYVLGEMGRHKVVAACLPDGEYGTNSAADVAANMRRTFPSIKFALLVGIGGGVPTAANDMRLGDVVVSRPTGTDPGVIQYDMGKARENGNFTLTGFLHPPPRLIMTALGKLRSDPHSSKSPLQESLQEIAACRREYRYPGRQHDRLFYNHYHHVPQEHDDCNRCDSEKLRPRSCHPDGYYKPFHPHVHYGTIASGNSVIRDGELRDYWARERNVLCFEMEAAGFMNTLPCLVIRGICDYADSHKNKVFQNYAAAAAASYAKLLLSNLRDLEDLEPTAQEVKIDEKVGNMGKLKSLRRVLKTNLAFFVR